MNRRTSKSKRIAFQRNSSPHKSAARRKNPISSIRQKLSAVAVWALVAVNAVLLASLVHRLLTPPNSTDLNVKKIMEDPLDVEVLNGCGVPGLANSFGDFLVKNRYDVVKRANAPTKDYQKSVLIDRGKRERKQIEKLREELGLSKDRVLPIEAPDALADATLILGADYESLKSYKEMR